MPYSLSEGNRPAINRQNKISNKIYTQEQMDKLLWNREFLGKVNRQHFDNLQKWGEKNVNILFKALVEEIGEIARALLGNPGENHNLMKECVDAGAVLQEIFNMELSKTQ